VAILTRAIIRHGFELSEYSLFGVTSVYIYVMFLIFFLIFLTKIFVCFIIEILIYLFTYLLCRHAARNGHGDNCPQLPFCPQQIFVDSQNVTSGVQTDKFTACSVSTIVLYPILNYLPLKILAAPQSV